MQEKWLGILIYCPLSQDAFSLNSLRKIIDSTLFKSLLDSSNLTNLIKNDTCFKGQRSSVDPIRKNRKLLFK